MFTSIEQYCWKKRPITAHMFLERLIPVSMVLLSIIGPTGYVRVHICASKAEFQISTWREMGFWDEIFPS